MVTPRIKYWCVQQSAMTGIFSQIVTDAGKIPSLGNITQQWTNGNFSNIQASLDTIIAAKAYPCIDWWTCIGSDATINANNITNSHILAGAWDSYIATWAAACKAWGKPLFIFFNSEPNGTWYHAFSDIVTSFGNFPGSFAQMWDYVLGIFASVGVTNVTWGWALNQQSADGSGAATAETTQPMSQFFPSVHKPHIIGLDLFNAGGSPGRGDKWFSLDNLIRGSGIASTSFGNSLLHLANLDPNLPLAIGSFGCDSRKGVDQNANWATNPQVDGAQKGAWFIDALLTQMQYAQADALYDRIELFRYYNDDINSQHPPFADGISTNDEDCAFENPTATAVSGTYGGLAYTITNPGQGNVAWTNSVRSSLWLGGGEFTIDATGRPPVPFIPLAYDNQETMYAAAKAVEYRFNDASKANGAICIDSSGNGLNGLYVGSSVTDVAGLPLNTLSRAFQTDGASYVRSVDNDLLSPQVGGKIWISFWYQLSALPTATSTFIAKGGGDGTIGSANTWEYTIDISSAQQWRWFLLTNAGAIAIGATANLTPTLNIPHRVDCAFDSALIDGNPNKAIIYHDGVRIGGGSTIGANVLTNSTAPMTIGRRGDGTNPIGTVANPVIIDEVRLRNVYPTSADVLAGYLRGLSQAIVSFGKNPFHVKSFESGVLSMSEFRV